MKKVFYVSECKTGKNCFKSFKNNETKASSKKKEEKENCKRVKND